MITQFLEILLGVAFSAALITVSKRYTELSLLRHCSVFHIGQLLIYPHWQHLVERFSTTSLLSRLSRQTHVNLELALSFVKAWHRTLP